MAENNTFPFWSTSVSKRVLPASKAYITLYGTLTGDIWHVAAAQILSQYANPAKVVHPFAQYDIHTCLTVMSYDKNKVPNGNKWDGFDATKHPTAPQPIGPHPSKRQATSSASASASESDAGGKRPKKRQATSTASGSDVGDMGPPATKKPKSTGEKEPKEANCVARGRKSWFYLRSIDCLPSLVIVPKIQSSNVVNLANTLLNADEADRWFADQLGFLATNAATLDMERTGFDRVVADQIEKMWTEHQRLNWPGGKGPSDDPRLIDLLCSTSIVMQMMDHLGWADAQKILGYRLSGGEGLSQAAKDTAEKKIMSLLQTIDSAVDEATKQGSSAVKGVVEGVVLFNFRIGDVNGQHDANVLILSQVRRMAAAKGYVTIAIPQMDGGIYSKKFKAALSGAPETAPAALQPFMGKYTFDLLDVDPPTGAPAAYMDNRAKAYFWHVTASFLQGKFSPLGAPEEAKAPPGILDPQRPPVVGMIGGRSGSTDLPAFVGLRVYSWEEPMLSPLPEGGAKPSKKGPWSASYYRVQGPQALRLFNQFPVTVTGSLDLTSFNGDKDHRGYEALDVSDGRLARWLNGGRQDENIPVPLPAKTHSYLKVSGITPLPAPDGLLKWRWIDSAASLHSPFVIGFF